MRTVVSVVWTTVPTDEIEALRERVRSDGGEVLQIPLRGLPAGILGLLAKGPVVAVVGTDQEASLALAIGVDEVLRAGEVTPYSVERAIDCARARATARAARDGAGRSLAHDWAAFSLVSTAIASELAGPLMVALTNCEVLASGLDIALGVGDEFVSWACSTHPTEHLRQLVARRTAAPDSAELISAVDDSRVALARAASILRALREVTYYVDAGRPTSVRAMLDDVGVLLSSYIASLAKLQIEACGPCIVRAPRAIVCSLLVCMLAEALESIRCAGLDSAELRVSASEEEDCVLVELYFAAPRRHADQPFRPHDPYFADLNVASSDDLRGMRDRARSIGGDLLVDNDDVGTTLRLLLPAGEDMALADLGDSLPGLAKPVSPSD